jgi:predicted O-methyltransferase YrrM
MIVTAHLLLWSFGLAAAETQISIDERQCLIRHAAAKRRPVEIGVWHGVSSSLIREAMAPDGILFLVDPFPPGRFGFSPQRIIAARQVSKVSNGSIRWLRATGVEGAAIYRASEPELPDFVFIDADHTYEALRGDWGAWSPLVRKTGIVALHDSCSSQSRNIDDAGSVRFTREVILPHSDFERVEVVETLTVLRRRK